MKKTGLSLLVLASALILAGCARVSVSADSSPAASSAAASSSAAMVSSEPVSSTAPASSSSSSSSSSETPISSSSVSATTVVKVMDPSVMGTGSAATDGFFYLGAGASVSNTSVKSGGTSQPDAASPKLVYFTTTGAGSITVTSHSGTNSAEGATRILFVAQVAEDGSWKAIGKSVDTFGVETAGKADSVEMTCVLPAASKYYILTSDSMYIDAVKVTFDTAVATLPATPIATSPADPNVFNPLEWVVGDVADQATMGNYGMVGSASRFKLQGSRTVIGKTKWCSMALDVAVGDALTYHATAAGTVSYYAEANVASGAVGTLTVTDATGAALTLSAPTFKSSKDDAKAPSSVSFPVVAGGTYKMAADVESMVFWANFTAE